jgi:hypothetical protein
MVKVIKRFYIYCGVMAIATAACSNGSSPSQPSGSTAAVDASATASVTAPRPLTPAAGALIRNADQPVTLVVTNAIVTSGSTVYTFEVATDSAFASKVYTKSGVAQTAGQTAQTISTLPAGADYYWRARADSGSTAGPYSAARKLTIGPAVQLDPPALLTPSSGATSQGWPAFTVRNVTKTGPAGPIVYRFEIATNNTFGNIVLTAQVNEGNTNTTYVPPSTQPAPPQNTLFWRVTATDTANQVTSPVSSVAIFTYTPPTQQALLAQQQGQALWPNAQPTGSNGQARMGPGWQLQTLRSFDGVTFTSPPIEALRIFDLLDRGYDPDGAINWMHSNGYATNAVWYPSVASIGLPFQYMALIQGTWELVTRVGA